MSNSPEAQRAAAVRKLTSDLYVLQDRMNQTIDQITRLLHGADPAALLLLPQEPVRAADGAFEHTLVPSALEQPLPAVYVDDPANGMSLGTGGDCKFFSDYKNGHVQLVQVPATRGSDARFGMVFNVANFDGTYLSLVFDCRALLQGLPTGRLRIGAAIGYAGDPAPKLHTKIAYKIDGVWGEHFLHLKGGKILVDSLDVPLIDPSKVEALDVHLTFTPAPRSCIELHRVTFSTSLQPSADAAAVQVFESAQ